MRIDSRALDSATRGRRLEPGRVVALGALLWLLAGALALGAQVCALARGPVSPAEGYRQARELGILDGLDAHPGSR